MKVPVDIVTGFLGSGKTTFINSILEEIQPDSRTAVVIQNESGEIPLDSLLVQNKNIHVYKADRSNPLDSAVIQGILEKYRPSRIIIEQNGMTPTESLLQLFDDSRLIKTCFVNHVYNLIDATLFETYQKNMGPMMAEQITACDTVIMGNAEKFTAGLAKQTEKSIRRLNKKADIEWFANNENSQIFSDGDSFQKVSANGGGRQPKRLSTPFVVFLALIAGYIFFTIMEAAFSSGMNIDLERIQVLNTVFISILIQAFPFILIGVLLSSIIQVLVPADVITRLFDRKGGFSYVAAIFAGVILPVCDCAIVPVARRLIQKGVPLSVAVTFMLSAPLVNPIVIASTLYAFPGQPAIAFYRVLIGIIIAIAVGLSISLLSDGKQGILSSADNFTCKCGYCGTEPAKGFKGKAEAILRHAGVEFFTVGKYVVIGAFLSALVQTFVPKELFSGLGGGEMLSLLVMMLCAFVLSVCSTSDAFIARTFVSQFSLGPVLGFMVLGPMIDMKNVLMLSGGFKKAFVIKLVALIFGISFPVILILTSLLL